MDHFGLDIGFGSIKAAWLRKEEKAFRLLSLGEVKSPEGIDLMVDSSLDRMAEAIRGLVTDLDIKTNFVSLALPERNTISRVLVYPPMKDSEVTKALFYEIETFVPYPQKDVQLDYQIIQKTKEKMLIFVVVSQKKIVAAYEKLAKKSGLVPVSLESTSVSLARALSSTNSKAAMIVDLGAKDSTMVVVKEGNIYLTNVAHVGGNAFTRAISISLGMDFLKAEEYKKTYGLQQDHWEGKIREALKEAFGHLADEIRKVMIAYKEEWNDEIGLLILSGGGATMPGLTDELVKVLGAEVQVANPLFGVKTEGAKRVVEDEENLSRFSVALGLAKLSLT
jgi:type IV pilus assembly protein PilM